MLVTSTLQGTSLKIPLSICHYEIQKLISRGSSSVIVQANLIKSCSKLNCPSNHKNYKLQKHLKTSFALKIMSRTDILERGLLPHVEKERSVLINLDHPNIVKLYDSFDFGDLIVFVMEHCDCDLFDYKDQLIEKFSNNDMEISHQKQLILKGVFDAIHYLHQKGISHGDLKLENIFIKVIKNSKKKAKNSFFENHNNITIVPKLGDFGYVRTSLIAGDDDKRGTEYYAAPELFHKGTFYTLKTDIWSLGICMSALYANVFPFCGDRKQIKEQIKKANLTFSNDMSPYQQNIIRLCTAKNPEDRPSISELKAIVFGFGNSN